MTRIPETTWTKDAHHVLMGRYDHIALMPTADDSGEDPLQPAHPQEADRWTICGVILGRDQWDDRDDELNQTVPLVHCVGLVHAVFLLDALHQVSGKPFMYRDAWHGEVPAVGISSWKDFEEHLEAHVEEEGYQGEDNPLRELIEAVRQIGSSRRIA